MRAGELIEGEIRYGVARCATRAARARSPHQRKQPSFRDPGRKELVVIARRVSRPGACAALLVCLAVTSLSPAALAHGQRAGRIAFDHAGADGAQDIVSIEPDGGDPRQLTHLAPGQGAELPAWDPDGGRLYFDSDLAGNVHLFAVNGNGHGLLQITGTDGFEIGARVSPDGKLMALEHEDADFTTGGIFVAPKHGVRLGRFHQLTASPALAMGGYDAVGDFSPDGSELAFLRVLNADRPTAMSAIFVIGLDGHALRQVTPYSLNAGNPRWSPDGTRLLFSGNLHNHSDQLSANVYTVRPDGTQLTQITHERDNRHAFTPDWAPDSTRIVYAYDAPGMDHTELRVKELAAGRDSVIWRGTPGTFDENPDWGRQP
jgi:Tol biopolymer transport system component